MEICIHRGSHQIGGSCVEIKHDGYRILVDLGLPLNAEKCDRKYLPNIPGIDGSDPSLLGILISHPHLDHFGLLPLVSKNIPVGIGDAAHRILSAAAGFLPDKFVVPSPGWNFNSEQPIIIGPFRVTPFLMDHSAYDAYSFLIEAGGKRLFYSGDIRAHGRKYALFERLLNKPPRDIDVLLLEGSSIGRIGDDDKFPSENQIESKLIEAFKETEGLALVHCSAQNIDRVVSVFRACRNTGRKLVVDLYAAAILEATGNQNIPQSHWPDMALYIPHSQRVHIKKHGMIDLLDRHKGNRIYIEHLKKYPHKLAILFRPVHIRDLERCPGLLSHALYIYSQWDGYWTDGKFAEVDRFLNRNNIPKIDIHTSGHASPADLKLFAEQLSPKQVVPIHSFMPGRYPEIFKNVEFHDDGEWWSAR